MLVRSLAVAFGSAAFVTLPAMAQTPPSGDNVQKVVVTGSLISRADKETPSPVQVLTADDLVKSGYTSVAEVLSNLAANGQGALGSGFSGAFANGGAGVSLRGLTVGLTLVLIDGHRMAPYPLSDDAQRQFVDVSSIPFDAVERIEVLKDGASSVYGSDAISGVVNVILKKSFKGTTINAEYGDSQHGGGKSKKVAVTTGIGDLATKGWSAFASLEVKESDAIKVFQRDDQEWANGDFRNRGGIDLRRGVPNPQNSRLVATNTPFFYRPNTTPDAQGRVGVNNPANFTFLTNDCDYTRYMASQCVIRDTFTNIKPRTDNINLLLGSTVKLGENWEMSMKASQFRRESTNNRGIPPAFSPSSFAGNTALVPNQNPAIVNVYGVTTFPATYPGNNTGGTARLYGIIPDVGGANETLNTSVSNRFAIDLVGQAYGWDVGGGIGASRVTTDIEYNGYVNRVALYNALNRPTNKFNPLGGNSAADRALITPTFRNKSTQDLKYADIHGSREVATIPGGGAVTLATGISYTKKELSAPSPSLLAQGTVANGAAYVFGDETNTAVFGEVNALVRNNLELSASARYDHYDTYGNSFTPGAKFKWAPMKQVTVRGTFAKGFRAPNAAEVGTASSLFSFHAINDPILCADGKPTTKDNVPSACNFAPAFVQVTSKNLEPEKSTSYTLGLILEPVKNVSATIDYFHIDVKNQINTASGLPGFVPDFVRNAIFPVEIADGKGGTAQGIPKAGTIAYATSGYVNSGGVETSGIELDLSVSQKFGDLGNFKGNLSYNHMISYKLNSAGVIYELAGTQGPSAVSGATGNPKDRAQLTLGWDKGPLNLTTTFNWVGSFSALDPSVEVNDCAHVADVSGRAYFFGGDTPAQYCKNPSFMSTDLNLTYKATPNLAFKLSVLNLFDKAPPVSVSTYGNSSNLTPYNATLHQAGAVGRYVSLGASYSF